MSTDFFYSFRREAQRITYSQGYYTSSGIFFNGTWINLEFVIFDPTYTLKVSFADLLDATISIPFDQDIYTTSLAIIEAFYSQLNIRTFFTPTPTPTMTKFGKLGIGIYPQPIVQEYVIDYCQILDSSGIPTEAFLPPSYYNSPIVTGIKACIQPIKGTDLLVLPEGLRDKEVFRLWTTQKLNSVTREDSYSAYPDKVSFDDTVYVVDISRPWINVPALGAICVVAQYEYYVTKYQPMILPIMEVDPVLGDARR